MAGIEGFLFIDLVPAGTDKRIPYLREKNKITNNAREHLLRLIMDDPATLTANPIIEYRIGGGGTGEIITGAETKLHFIGVSAGPLEDAATGGYSPTNLTGPYPSTAIAKSYVVGNSRIVDVQFNLDTLSGNGLSIDEVGLFCQNGWMGDLATKGRMFNIKNFDAINKTNAFSIAFTWRINFSSSCA